ncbi:MAG: dephospho-CoA kinase [Bacteroidales bacterium]|nr:dephospho-CoA kinase [Bacteroidales bacterium]
MKTGKKPGMKLGVTGGIGSGKTCVCKVFSILGIPVFSADQEAKEIMNNDKSIIRRLNSITGRNLYTDGNLDRKELAAIIFNDNTLLQKVNSLVHPIVFENFRRWELEQPAPYVIMEAAILFESGASKFVDRIATVVAPVEERMERVISRNNLTREQVLDRMRNQMDDESRIKLSDYVIHNSETDMIIPAILKIHEDILTYIKTGTR